VDVSLCIANGLDRCYLRGLPPLFPIVAGPDLHIERICPRLLLLFVHVNPPSENPNEVLAVSSASEDPPDGPPNRRQTATAPAQLRLLIPSPGFSPKKSCASHTGFTDAIFGASQGCFRLSQDLIFSSNACAPDCFCSLCMVILPVKTQTKYLQPP
jgi:hypothetical protein